MGEQNDVRFGTVVNAGGDVNADGYDDVVVGAYLENDSGQPQSGTGYVFLGRASWPTPISAAAADLRMLGEAAVDELGIYCSPAGDVDGDGRDDVIFGAQRNDRSAGNAGTAYLYLGSDILPGLVGAGLSAVIVTGEAGGDLLGSGTGWVGDFNRDGFADFAIGAHMANPNGADSGRAYVFNGSATPAGTYSASTADLIISGNAANDQLARRVGD